MNSKMTVIKRWFGDSSEERIVGMIGNAGLVFDNTLVSGRENVSTMRVLANDLDVPHPRTFSLETLRACVVLEIERACRAEEKEAK